MYAEAEVFYMEEKTCSDCVVLKPLTDFYRDPSGYYQGRCRPCSAEKQRRYLATPEGRAKRKAWEERLVEAKGGRKNHVVREGDVSRPCTACGEDKPFSEFYKSSKGHPASKCKVCVGIQNKARLAVMSDEARAARREKQTARLRADPERARAWRQKWAEKNPERSAFLRSENYYRNRYNMTLAGFEEMVAAQGGCCAACKAPTDALQVDHDHACCPDEKSCGACVRGLLCSGCNSALGRVNDDVDRLMSLATYVLQRKSVLNFEERSA